jgi:hypothetical protein
MRKVLNAAIFLKRDGSTYWEIKTPSGKLLTAGGTRRGKYAPKDAIGLACESVKAALKRGGEPSFSIRGCRRPKKTNRPLKALIRLRR